MMLLKKWGHIRISQSLIFFCFWATTSSFCPYCSGVGTQVPSPPWPLSPCFIYIPHKPWSLYWKKTPNSILRTKQWGARPLTPLPWILYFKYCRQQLQWLVYICVLSLTHLNGLPFPYIQWIFLNRLVLSSKSLSLLKPPCSSEKSRY